MKRWSVAVVVLASLGLQTWVAADVDARPKANALKRRDPSAAYPERVAALEKKRADLSARWKKATTRTEKRKIRKEAGAAVLSSIRTDLFPAWNGTKWSFYGTTTTPREGEIACGYYVTTVLRDAGFKVERAKLAQQAAEKIVKTLVPDDDTWRFRKGDTSLVIDKVREEGDGLYVVGLDNHVGFLDVAGKDVKFCHASYTNRADVRCEDPAKSTVFESKYHVVGRLFTAKMLTAWLEGKDLPTYTD